MEAVLRQADNAIDFIEFTSKGEGETLHETIRIYYANDHEIVIPVTNMSLMDILSKTSEMCAPQHELRILEESKPAMWPVPPETFEQWAETEEAQLDAWCFLKYRYRLSSVEADYIFGKMALFLMQK